MPRSIPLPPVAHIVADLDDLTIGVPRRRPRSLAGRVSSMLHRIPARRALSFAAMGALLVAIAACSDSDAPVTGPVPVALVRVSPTTLVLAQGTARQVTAVALDADGNVLPGREVQWSTDAPQVATVSASGLVQAVAHGYAGITATVEGKAATTAVTVTEPDPAMPYDLVYERRLFNGDGEIRRLSLVTGAVTTLPLAVTIPGTFVRDVAPSPDGTRVAFTIAWYPDGGPTLDGDIYVANVDGTGFRRLTAAAEMDEQPAWSPDGARIAFRSRRSGNWDIWVMAADGTGQVNLMEDVLPATSTETTPAWSPDGTRIVYSSDLDNFAYPKLWTMRANGGDKRRVLPLAIGTGDIDREPSWSPDGARITFRRVNGAFGSDIMIATIASGALLRIPLEGVQAYPSWSPDGSLIAFASNHQQNVSQIFTMRPDGTDIDQHTVGDVEHTYPRWLPRVSTGRSR